MRSGPAFSMIGVHAFGTNDDCSGHPVALV